MPSKPTLITFASHGVTLQALFSQRDSEHLLLFLPGISGKSLSSRYDFLQTIADKTNYSLVRMDFCFQQHKDKSFTLQDCIADVTNLVDYLKKHKLSSTKNLVVICKSMGAFVATMSSLPFTKAIFYGPFMLFGKTNPSSILSLPLDKVSNDQMCITQQHLKFYPCLILHGTQDEVISLENSKKICQAKKNYHLHEIDGANHSFDRAEDIPRLVEETVAFINN